jgi:hypothetical protein
VIATIAPSGSIHRRLPASSDATGWTIPFFDRVLFADLGYEGA